MICRSCTKSEIQPVFSLGNQPLANALLDTKPDKEPRYPLELAVCPECGQAQLTNTVPPEAMFTDYPYLSSAAPAVVRNAKEIVERAVRERGLNDKSFVVEIASNDGYLLKNYDERRIPRLGIDPASNVVSRDPGYKYATLAAYFSLELAQKIAVGYAKADVIHANNVLAHVPTPNDFMVGIRELLKPGGVAIIEVPYARRMVEQGEFDTIYHEHVFYFTVTTLRNLVERSGLHLQSTEETKLHGGTMRAWIGHEPITYKGIEEPTSVNTVEFYSELERFASESGDRLWDLLLEVRNSGKSVAAYGAAAKGTVLLNYYGIGNEQIDYVVDDAESKQGKLMPGVHIPIYHPSRLMSAPTPDYLLILAWNHAKDIIKRCKGFKGKFIIPIPKLEVVEVESNVTT